MKQSWKEFIQIWQKPLLALAGVLVFSLYSVINFALLASKVQGASLLTWVDRAAPFWPSWQYVYFSVYFFVFLPAFFIKDNLLFRRIFYSFLLLQITAFIIFILYPTQIQRPQVGESDFISWGITLNQFLDPPYNCFPSLHVGNSFMAAFGILAADTPLGIIAIIWATLIAFSTVLVRHHFFVDVLAGFALSVLFYGILIYPLRKREIKKEELHRSRLWMLLSLSLFIMGVLVAYIYFLASR